MIIKNQLLQEHINLIDKDDNNPRTNQKKVAFRDLAEIDQIPYIKERLKTYSQKVYRRTYVEEIEEKEAIICQKENAFYVDTVRNFRDRRYVYKKYKKQAERSLSEANNGIEIVKAKDLVLL